MIHPNHQVKPPYSQFFQKQPKPSNKPGYQPYPDSESKHRLNGDEPPAAAMKGGGPDAVDGERLNQRFDTPPCLLRYAEIAGRIRQ
jgi:hypothetical protein